MKTYLVNNKYKIKADSAIQAAKLAKIVDSRKDSENIKLEQLTKGDVFYDPHYQEKCKIIEIDDDQYRVQSLTTGKTYWKNKRASVVKDAVPIEVEKVVYSIDDIKVLEYTYDNRKMWIVTSNYHGEKTYHGGGSVEYSKSDAIATANSFATIQKLEKKYGRSEAHKRYVAGQFDSMKKDSKIFKNQKEFEQYAISKFGKGQVYENESDITGNSYMYVTPKGTIYYNLKENGSIETDIKDSENSVIEYLTEEEEKAVEDYKKAIQSTSNPTLLKMFQHILQEELEHIEELNGVKNEEGIQDDASLTSEIKEYFSENLPNIKITNITWIDKQALIKTTNDDQAYKALKRDYAYNTVEKNSNGIMIYFD